MADLFLIDPTFHRDLNAGSTDSPTDGSTNSTTTDVMESYKNMLQAEDVEFGDPDSEAKEEHGKPTPGPVVNAGKQAYFFDVFVFVDRLNELAHKHGQYLVKGMYQDAREDQP